jgi:hypothetical protein
LKNFVNFFCFCACGPIIQNFILFLSNNLDRLSQKDTNATA